MMEDKLKLAVIGISHKTTSISSLESFQLDRIEISCALRYLKKIPQINGAVIISTCNRVEFYFTFKETVDPFTVIKKYYSERKELNISKKRNSFYCYKNRSAANHLFGVISGLDSMVLGEYQIQGQVKEFYSIACSEKAADKVIHKLFHAAFRVGKSVRSHTSFGSGKQSVSGVAFQIIKENLKREDSVAIIGVNQNTKIIAEKLSAAGFTKLIFINRTLHKAQQLANQFSGTAFGFDNLAKALSNVNCIFSCTGAPGYILTSELLQNIYSESGFPELIIDMAVPRDIETVGLPGSTEIFNLEKLKQYIENQQKEIATDIPAVEKIIAEETDLFEAWNESDGDGLIEYYNERIESVRQQFLNENTENLTEEEYLLLDKYSRSLTHRLKSTLHQIVMTTSGQKKAG